MAPAAKRRKVEPVEEITFDPEARQEYLTGFHKRKQQRIENAKDAAVKREKEERVKERKQIRDQRKEDLNRHIAEVNAEFKKQNPDLSESEDDDGLGGDEVEWEGIEDGEEDVAQDEEFVDEDKFTTVTVEAMGDPRDGLDDESEAENPKTKEAVTNGEMKAPKKRVGNKEGKAKQKKRKFRYESKAERQVTRQKIKSKNHAAKLRRKGQ